MDLVVDIGNSFLKAGLFNDGRLESSFALSIEQVQKKQLQERLHGKNIRAALVSSVNVKADQAVKEALDAASIPTHHLHYKNLNIILDVEEPEQVGGDRIANVYGALHRFPVNDCIVIDIGTAITFDYISKEGRYLGGAIAPGGDICAKALADYTDKLPLVAIEKPPSPLAKTTKAHIQSGIYYGLLGAIERIVAELQMTANSPSSVMAIATGGIIHPDHGQTEFLEDLKEIVDAVDPHLTLIGLHEILKELINKNTLI